MSRGLLIFLIPILIVISIVAPSKVYSHHLSDHHTGHWRLPFIGTRIITNAAGEAAHIAISEEALDYAGSFIVRAPADGEILDVVNRPADFGWVLRIKHPDPLGNSANDVVSFYAHMTSGVNNWTSGTAVTQGDYLGTSSDTGDWADGEHLHFEARIGVTAGLANLDSGQSKPITGILGQWWNSWYSPSPNFQSDPNQHSGAAQYLPNVSVPSSMPTPGAPHRHLANFESPTNEPSVYFTNVTNTSVAINWGARPNSQFPLQLRSNFLMKQYVTGTGWQILPGWNTLNPSVTHTVNSSNQCTPSNQHCHVVWSHSNQTGWSTYRTFYFYPGESGTGRPYASVSYRAGATNPNIAVLNYDRANATWFQVFEDTPGGGAPTTVYYGKAKSISVVHQSNRSYQVHAWRSGYGWQATPWIVP